MSKKFINIIFSLNKISSSFSKMVFGCTIQVIILDSSQTSSQYKFSPSLFNLIIKLDLAPTF